MKGSSNLGELKFENPYKNMEYSGFHHNTSPKFSGLKNSFFTNQEPLNLGFAYPKYDKEENINFHFAEQEKNFYSSDKEDDLNFFFNEDSRPESFRKPMKERKDSLKDAETVCNTKEAIPISKKDGSNQSMSTESTKSEPLSTSAKASPGFEYSLFSDLCQIKEDTLPDLNSLVSLSLDQGGSSLSVKLCSCNMSQCRLLHNFLQLAEEPDLDQMMTALDSAKADLSEQLTKLKNQQQE